MASPLSYSADEHGRSPSQEVVWAASSVVDSQNWEREMSPFQLLDSKSPILNFIEKAQWSGFSVDQHREP
jgi:hypothetical protein